MHLNQSKRDESAAASTAVVIDFEAQKACRRERRLDAAAPGAAVALARFEAGQVAWPELMAALIAPFNT
jgi:hypothetical protein